MAACERVNVCVWVRDGERERLSLYTVSVSVNNLVCSTSPQGVKVWGRGGLLRVASVMLSCSFPEFNMPRRLYRLHVRISHRFVNLILRKVVKYRCEIMWTMCKNVHIRLFSWLCLHVVARMCFIKGSSMMLQCFYTAPLHYFITDLINLIISQQICMVLCFTMRLLVFFCSQARENEKYSTIWWRSAVIHSSE